MARKKEKDEMGAEMVEQIRRDLECEKGKDVACIIMDIPISPDPDDPIRKVVDEVLGDFVEIETPNGTFFFPTRILRS